MDFSEDDNDVEERSDKDNSLPGSRRSDILGRQFSEQPVSSDHQGEEFLPEGQDKKYSPIDSKQGQKTIDDIANAPATPPKGSAGHEPAGETKDAGYSAEKTDIVPSEEKARIRQDIETANKEKQTLDTKLPEPKKGEKEPPMYYYSDYLETLKNRGQDSPQKGKDSAEAKEGLDEDVAHMVYKNDASLNPERPAGGHRNFIHGKPDPAYENNRPGQDSDTRDIYGYPKALSTIPAEEPKKDEQPGNIYTKQPSYHGKKDRPGSTGTVTIEEVDIGNEKGYSPLYSPSKGGSLPLDSPSDGGSSPLYSPSKGGCLPLDTPSQSGHTLGDILNNKNSEQDKPAAEFLIPSDPNPNKGYYNSKPENKPTTADDWNRQFLPERYNEQFNPDNWNRRFNEDYNRQMIQQHINQQNQNAAIYYNQVHRHHR